MATLQDNLKILKDNPQEAGGYNQIISAGLQAKQAGTDTNSAMQTMYDKLYPTQTPAPLPGIANDIIQAKAQEVMPDVAPAADIMQAANVGQLPTQSQPVDMGNIGAMRASQTEVEKAWQAKQDAFDATRGGGPVVNFEQPKPATTPTTPKVDKIPTGATPEQIKARQDQIASNLDLAYKDPNSVAKSLIDSGDYEGFKKIYSSTIPAEAQAVDAYFNAKQPKTEDAFYNLLRQGQTITSPTLINNALYKQAKARYDAFKTFSSYSSGQLGSAIVNGNIVQGQKVYNDLMNDPLTAAKLKEAEIFNNASGKTTNIAKVSANQTETILTTNTNTKNALSDGVITPDEYKAMLETPEITSKRQDVEIKKNKYDTLKAEYDAVETAVKEEFKGRDVSSNFIQYVISDRRKGMQKDLEVATSTYNNALGTLTDMQKTQASIVDMNFQMYQKQEERQYQAEQANREFDLKYGNINSTDPRIQKVGFERMAAQIQEQYKGMPFRRDVATMAQDFQNAYNSGQSIEQITTDVTNAIQNAPDYKNWQIQSGKTPVDKYDYKPIQGTDNNGNLITTGYIAVNKTDPTDTFRIGLDGQKVSGPIEGTPTGGYGNVTYEPGQGLSFTALASKYPNEASLKNNNPAGITWNANFDNKTPGSTAALLDKYGIPYNKGTARPSAEGGNYVSFPTVEAGLAAYQLMWSPEGKYGNMNIGKALNTWGTGSNTSLSGIDKNKKVSDLSQEQLFLLQLSQLRKESPGFLKELVNNGIVQKGQIGFGTSPQSKQAQPTQGFDPAYQGKYENALKGNYPDGIKSGSEAARKIDAEAKAWYANTKGLNPIPQLNKYEELRNIQLDTKANGDQRKSKAYGERMLYSVENLMNNEINFANLPLLEQTYQYNVPNWLKSPEQQKYETLKENFITASLRQESGAAISPSEFVKEEKKYFAQPGDSIDTVKAKQNAREVAIMSMLGQAGNSIEGISLSAMYSPKNIESYWNNKTTEYNKYF